MLVAKTFGSIQIGLDKEEEEASCGWWSCRQEELGHRALAGWGHLELSVGFQPFATSGSSERQTFVLDSSTPPLLSPEGRTMYIIMLRLLVEGHIVPSHLLAQLIAWAAGPLLWEPDWVWEEQEGSEVIFLFCVIWLWSSECIFSAGYTVTW